MASTKVDKHEPKRRVEKSGGTCAALPGEQKKYCIVCCVEAVDPSVLRRGETHAPVHSTFINLMKKPNEETLIVLIPASNHFMV